MYLTNVGRRVNFYFGQHLKPAYQAVQLLSLQDFVYLITHYNLFRRTFSVKS